MRAPILAAAVVATLLASTASAQQASASDNLDCAIWASFSVGASQDEEERGGLMIAAAWFIGLYEGQTGRKIDDDMGPRALALTPETVKGMEPACLARFADFGNRMTTLGSELTASSK